MYALVGLLFAIVGLLFRIVSLVLKDQWLDEVMILRAFPPGLKEKKKEVTSYLDMRAQDACHYKIRS